jgi:hypothetical protein
MTKKQYRYATVPPSFCFLQSRQAKIRLMFALKTKRYGVFKNCLGLLFDVEISTINCQIKEIYKNKEQLEIATFENLE